MGDRRTYRSVFIEFLACHPPLDRRFSRRLSSQDKNQRELHLKPTQPHDYFHPLRHKHLPHDFLQPFTAPHSRMSDSSSVTASTMGLGIEAPAKEANTTKSFKSTARDKVPACVCILCLYTCPCRHVYRDIVPRDTCVCVFLCLRDACVLEISSCCLCVCVSLSLAALAQWQDPFHFQARRWRRQQLGQGN
jgi:hypothetical protein